MLFRQSKLGVADYLGDALVAKTDDLGDGTEGHSGRVGVADGGVSLLAGTGVLGDGSGEALGRVHEVSLENLTNTCKSSIKLDMTSNEETHSALVDRMAKLRAFIDQGRAFLKTAPERTEHTAKIAQAIQAARKEHDELRRQAVAVRPADWLSG